jgi:hypothetical protein
MAAIGRKIGFATESAECDHAVVTRLFAEKSGGIKSPKFLALPKGRKAIGVHRVKEPRFIVVL